MNKLAFWCIEAVSGVALLESGFEDTSALDKLKNWILGSKKGFLDKYGHMCIYIGRRFIVLILGGSHTEIEDLLLSVHLGIGVTLSRESLLKAFKGSLFTSSIPRLSSE